MKQYLAVLAPRANGGWHAHFPDFPDCSGMGTTLEVAMNVAAAAARERVDELQSEGQSLPIARTYREIRNNPSWAIDHGIDWSTAVIGLVPVAC